ncbi:acetyltransferase [Bacteroidota bacterium]
MKKPIILIGGGGHCKSCIDVIEQNNQFQIKGIVDLPEKKGQDILGYQIFATDDDLKVLSHEYKYFLITLGQIDSADRRKTLFNALKEFNITLPVIQSPLAYVSPHAEVGEGTIIMHNALINSNAKIGNNCIINTKALIEHDVQIGNHCHISTGAIVNGSTVIGDETFFGSGAVSKENIKIPAKSFIKANSIVK